MVSILHGTMKVLLEIFNFNLQRGYNIGHIRESFIK